LKEFFFRHVFENINIANSFHWLVHLDKENDNNEPEIQDVYRSLYEELINQLAANYSDYYINIDL